MSTHGKLNQCDEGCTSPLPQDQNCRSAKKSSFREVVVASEKELCQKIGEPYSEQLEEGGWRTAFLMDFDERIVYLMRKDD